MTRSALLVLLLAAGVAWAGEAPAPKPAGTPAESQEKTKDEAQEKAKKDAGTKKDDPNLGMSILGNQEAPKALVIVPWKQSEMGDAHGISTMLDDSRLPIDKEVFMRMLSYYEIRSETSRHDGAPSTGRETAPAGAAQPVKTPHRRKS